jgi:hypothetical protein
LSALQLRGWTSISGTIVGNCQALEKNVTRPFRHTNEQQAGSNLVGARPEVLMQTLLELPQSLGFAVILLDAEAVFQGLYEGQ